MNEKTKKCLDELRKRGVSFDTVQHLKTLATAASKRESATEGLEGKLKSALDERDSFKEQFEVLLWEKAAQQQGHGIIHPTVAGAVGLQARKHFDEVVRNPDGSLGINGKGRETFKNWLEGRREEDPTWFLDFEANGQERGAGGSTATTNGPPTPKSTRKDYSTSEAADFISKEGPAAWLSMPSGEVLPGV